MNKKRSMLSIPQHLSDTIRTALLTRKESVAVAESVTAGLLQFAFSTIPDASSFFQGGITAFNLAQKYKHLQVEPIHAMDVNCVSKKVAVEMSLQVCQLFSSDWGMGITGYATPIEESGNELFAYYAITHRGKIKAEARIKPRATEPQQVQEEYVQHVLRRLASIFAR
jgi:PncC family amidohydrolase